MGIMNSKLGGGRKQEKEFVAGICSLVKERNIRGESSKTSRTSWESGKLFFSSFSLYFLSKIPFFFHFNQGTKANIWKKKKTRSSIKNFYHLPMSCLFHFIFPINFVLILDNQGQLALIQTFFFFFFKIIFHLILREFHNPFFVVVFPFIPT